MRPHPRLVRRGFGRRGINLATIGREESRKMGFGAHVVFLIRRGTRATLAIRFQATNYRGPAVHATVVSFLDFLFFCPLLRQESEI